MFQVRWVRPCAARESLPGGNRPLFDYVDWNRHNVWNFFVRQELQLQFALVRRREREIAGFADGQRLDRGFEPPPIRRNESAVNLKRPPIQGVISVG